MLQKADDQREAQRKRLGCCCCYVSWSGSRFHSCVQFVKKSFICGFPGGSVVKNLPANAGDVFSPWTGKTPLAVLQVSLCRSYQACALEPRNHNAEPKCHTSEACSSQSLCPETREATAMRSLRTATREQPPLATIRGKPKQQRRLNTAKKKKKKITELNTYIHFSHIYYASVKKF